MKIYLAGKITANDWRHTIVPALRAGEPLVYQSTGPRDHDSMPVFGFPVLQGAIFGVHDYVGPFFVSCDHGCYHHAESHGVGAWDDEWGGHGDPYNCQVATENLPRRAEVVRVCLEAIDRADVVFAWFDDPNCHGTLTEVGYAVAKGKRLWAGFGAPGLWSDLWFARSAAVKVAHYREGIGAAGVLHEMLTLSVQELRTMPYKDYLQTSHWKERRLVALNAAGYRCQLCNRDGRLEVHHRTYERRGAELPSDLVALCDVCHRHFHGRIGLSNGKVGAR